MTNEQIIFNAACDLLKDGKINGTGRLLLVQTPDGTETTIPEPEAIHTFQRWKSLGYSVRKGEKAVTKLSIWKHTTKPAETEEEQPESRMFMKVSAFFAASQVEPIPARA